MRHQRKFISRVFFNAFTLIIVTTFVYQSSQTYHNLNTISFDEINSIRRTLEQIQTCTSDDQSRQRALLYTLHIWKHYAQQYHIQYWIAYRTLVGHVQRHSLLPHDFHIDLFIMAQDTPHLIQLSQSNFSAMYNLKVHPQWYIVEQTKRSYFHSEGIDFILPNAQFVNIKESVYINIWAMYDYNPNESRMLKKNTTMVTSYDRDYQWKSTPKEWTFPLQECDLGGIEVWCPAQPGKLVSDLYGDLPIYTSWIKCVNGSWIKSNNYTSMQKISTYSESTPAGKSITNLITMKTTTDNLNDLKLIDKALDFIPICTKHDRLRQRALLRTLQVWSKLAEKNNLQYWISYGTLVGYVQRRGLLPHDEDIDVTIMADDMPKLLNISQTNFSTKYKFKIQPKWNVVGYKNRSYFYEQGIDFTAPNARFFHLKSRRYVDIFPAYDFNPLASNNLTEYNADFEWLSYPRSWTYPLQKCYFNEIKVLCPAKPERLVEINYGRSALIKSDTKCVKGSWVGVNSN